MALNLALETWEKKSVSSEDNLKYRMVQKHAPKIENFETDASVMQLFYNATISVSTGKVRPFATNTLAVGDCLAPAQILLSLSVIGTDSIYRWFPCSAYILLAGDGYFLTSHRILEVF